MPIDSSHDEHGLTKPEPHADPKRDAEHPGYELTDVNTRGIAVFMAGLLGFLIVFFVLCYGMGMAINSGFEKQDTAEINRRPQPLSGAGKPIAAKTSNMADNMTMEQESAAMLTKSFPTPRLDADDGNQGIADVHSREDLLLEHYSTTDASGNAVRIPIERAMQLIVQRGLPQAPEAVQSSMFGEDKVAVHAPLTNGFARTGYELEQIESRQQALEQKKAAE